MSEAFWTGFWTNLPAIITALGIGIPAIIGSVVNAMQAHAAKIRLEETQVKLAENTLLTKNAALATDKKIAENTALTQATVAKVEEVRKATDGLVGQLQDAAFIAGVKSETDKQQ